MITLDQFVAQWDGKFADFDKQFGNQCADLAQYFARDVVGAPPFTGAGAVNFWSTYDRALYTAIANTPANTPQPGDVVIWVQNAAAGTGIYGHVVIAVAPISVTRFAGFSQNWPTGSPCHVVTFTYDGVVGWLRPHALTHATPPPPAVTPPPADAAAAVAVLARHVELLTAHPSVGDTNALVHGISTWPTFKD